MAYVPSRLPLVEFHTEKHNTEVLQWATVTLITADENLFLPGL